MKTSAFGSDELIRSNAISTTNLFTRSLSPHKKNHILMTTSLRVHGSTKFRHLLFSRCHSCACACVTVHTGEHIYLPASHIRVILSVLARIILSLVCIFCSVSLLLPTNLKFACAAVKARSPLPLLTRGDSSTALCPQQ